MDIRLDHVEIEKIKLDSKVLPSEPTELNVEIENNTEASEDGKRCLRKMVLKIYTGEGKKARLFIEVGICGHLFTNDLFEDTEEINMAIEGKLFPYLQSYVATITALAGLPALIIPEPKR